MRVGPKMVIDEADSYDEVRSDFEWDVPESYNLGGCVEKAGTADREATALIHLDDEGGKHRFTYDELDRAAASLAGHLLESGVEPGDRVALCFPQSPELLVAHLATYRIGCVTVPLSVILGSASFAHSLTHSEATTLIADARVYERFESTVAALDLGLELVIDLDGRHYEGSDRHLGGYAPVISTDRTPGISETAPEEPAIVVYTSGTSGKPKGVVQRHQYVLGTLPGYQCWFHCFGERHRERVWTPAEWAWAGALFDVVFPTLELGGTVVSNVRRRGFDPTRALELIDRLGVTRAFMPSTAMWQIRDETDPKGHDLSSLEVVMCGGEKLAVPVGEWAERELDIVVNEAYGQTEANALVGNCQALFDVKPGSMGRAYPGHEVAVLDEDLEPVEPGEIGQIALDRSDPVIFEGYLDDPEATDECFAGGWYLTGDLARIDEAGYLTFAGRADDLIVTAGYRVSPAEVESALCDSPLVANAAVGGVPDEERGQRIYAYVLLEDAHEAPPEREESTAETLRQQVRDAIGPHKTPHEIEILEEPPKTRTGKLDRATLFPD